MLSHQVPVHVQAEAHKWVQDMMAGVQWLCAPRKRGDERQRHGDDDEKGAKIEAGMTKKKEGKEKEKEEESKSNRGRQWNEAGLQETTQRGEVKKRKLERYERSDLQKEEDVALCKSVTKGKQCPFCAGDFSPQEFSLHVDQCSMWS